MTWACVTVVSGGILLVNQTLPPLVSGPIPIHGLIYEIETRALIEMPDATAAGVAS